jgi:hypothetical protein
MRWRKLGLVWGPDGSMPWAKTHASVPTPVPLPSGAIRVYLTCLDGAGRGRPTWVDVSPSDPTQVLAVAREPLLEIGRPGTFDDNGLMVTSVVPIDDHTVVMYYAGFEICTHVRYRIFTGGAVSHDGGDTFARVGEVPILDRCDGELYFRGGPFALLDGERFKLWYVSGSAWTDLGDGKPMPVYDLRYMESPDPFRWTGGGRLSMAVSGSDEHGFGRPWVVKRATGDYRLFYSCRRRSLKAYRLGYAESVDGINWTRKDADMGLDVSPNGFDDEAIMYSAVINIGDRTYCFYNGNNFGQRGFGVAIQEA